jgi:hypothetical protein
MPVRVLPHDLVKKKGLAVTRRGIHALRTIQIRRCGSDWLTQTIRGTDRSARANVRIDISIAEIAAALSAGSGCGWRKVEMRSTSVRIGRNRP